MKKILFFALTTISLFTFSSCLDTGYELPTSPVQGGVRIYSEASMHNNYVLFCADMAYRLNVLLEAKTEGQDIKDVMLVVGEDKTANGIVTLFKGMIVKIENPIGSIWQFTFTPNIPTSTHEGSLTVSTGGKLLSEVGAEWRVTNTVGVTMSYSGGGIYTGVSGNGVEISHLSQGLFTIDVQGFGLYNIVSDPEQIMKSRWATKYTLRKSDANDFSLLGMRNSTYELTGYTGGVPEGESDDIQFSYRIDDSSEAPSPLKFKYDERTQKMVLYSGAEITKCPRLAVAFPEQYPSEEVTVIWKEKDGYTFYNLIYNGVEISTQPNTAE